MGKRRYLEPAMSIELVCCRDRGRDRGATRDKAARHTYGRASEMLIRKSLFVSGSIV